MNRNNFTSNEDTQARQEKTHKPEARGGEPEKEAMERVKRAGKNIVRQMESQIDERPMVVLGAVAGVGFIAGSLIGSRLGQLAIAIAGGYALHEIVQRGGGVEKLMKEGIDKLAGGSTS